MNKQNNMRWSEIMYLLDQETEWCTENEPGMVEGKYKDGFLAGLSQAKYLITKVYKIGKMLDTEERKPSCSCGETPCTCPFQEIQTVQNCTELNV